MLRRTPIPKKRVRPRFGWKPIPRKQSNSYRRRTRHRDYLAWIASLPCAICGCRPVEVAHLGERGLSQKCSDLETGPLCTRHHARGYPESHHSLGKRFWSHHGIDRDTLFARLQAAFEAFKQQI